MESTLLQITFILFSHTYILSANTYKTLLQLKKQRPKVITLKRLLRGVISAKLVEVFNIYTLMHVLITLVLP